MYLHCKHGFVEADAWDGQPLPIAAHQSHVEQLANVNGTVIVVRSRRSDTLLALIDKLPRTDVSGVLPQIIVYKSPVGWDYEWRCYLTPIEWGMCMTTVAMDLDYRNFKHTAQDEHGIAYREYPLALAIWNAAHKNVPRDGEPDPVRPPPQRYQPTFAFGHDVPHAAESDTIADALNAAIAKGKRK